MNYRNHIIILLAFFLISCSQPNPPKSFIAVNLVGYESGAEKQAFLVNGQSDGFEVLRAEDLTSVYSDSTSSQKPVDTATGDKIILLDFSDLSTPGTYKLKAINSDAPISESFTIKSNVYEEALYAVLNSYYYHRCGTKVGKKFKSKWNYQVCHLDDAPFYNDPDHKKTVTGGWHDAGDYNKFSTNTSLSAGLLLYAYEWNPGLFSDNQLEIPETGNGIPDVLDEVSWGMKWLLRMQNKDGGIYHKVSQKKWVGEYLPNHDPAERYIFEVSSSATASFAASAALASRHLQSFDPKLSKQLSDAALNAWDYLALHPQDIPKGGFKNPDDVSGGEYGDPSDTDERLWAAAELYRLTGNNKFQRFFANNINSINLNRIPPISWRDANSLAIFSFLQSKADDQLNEEKEAIREALIRHADNLINTSKRNNYQNLLQPEEYYWGSNSVGLAYAFDLMQAHSITGNSTYLHAAKDQLHYILGRNPFNRSQVTGVGTVSVKHPYHQLSEVGPFSKPVAGMLVGGPNNRLHLNDDPISNYPGKNYEDQFRNYLVNEPAINFTAILALVVTSVSDPTVPQQATVLTTQNE